MTATSSYDEIAAWYADLVRGESWPHETIRLHLDMLTGPVAGQRIIDIGCGEGMFSHYLALRGAIVTGVDLSGALLALARQAPDHQPHAIRYIADDAQTLSALPDEHDDGAICMLALMDIPDVQSVFRTAARVVVPGGWLVIAITHPCFQPPHASWLDDGRGNLRRVVSGYVNECFWRSEHATGVRSQVGAWHRTLSSYLNAAADAGWALEHAIEPVNVDPTAVERRGSSDIPGLFLARFTRIAR